MAVFLSNRHWLIHIDFRLLFAGRTIESAALIIILKGAFTCMNTNLLRKTRTYWLVFFLIALLTLLTPACATADANQTSAADLDGPAAETAVIDMTEEEFATARAAWELRVTTAYDDLFATLAEEQQPYLQEAQIVWQEYYVRFAALLQAQLNIPLTLSGGVEGEEHETNIYRETVFTILDQRAAELEAWAKGSYDRAEEDAVAELKKEIRTQKGVLANILMMNTTYMDENFRLYWLDARDCWYEFLQNDTIFVSAATRSDGKAMVAEELSQLQRMISIALTYQEGLLQIRTGREE